MAIRNQLPNLITALNLLAGCLSIMFVAEGNITLASLMIMVASVFDFLDGFVARILNAYSKLGAQLDSLADVVSFGVAPGFIMYFLIRESTNQLSDEMSFVHFLPFLAFLIPVFSAIRLAKFNLDERQTDNFIGLPTPAASIFIAGLPFLFAKTLISIPPLECFISHHYFLTFLVLILSAIMVSGVSLFSLKFKSFKISGKKARYVFLFLSLILLILLHFAALPVIILVYIILSLMQRRNSESN